MSATEDLRALLDERGVEWTEGIARPELTQVRIDGKVVKFHPWQPSTLKVSLFDITPEQAIAAMLGLCSCSNNCTNSERTETCHAVETDRYRVRTEGTGCPLTVRIMKCSKCGGAYGYVTGGYEYCPRCGRKVVDPTTNDVNTEVDDD